MLVLLDGERVDQGRRHQPDHTAFLLVRFNNNLDASNRKYGKDMGARALEKRRPLLWSTVGTLLYPLYLVGTLWAAEEIHYHPLHHPHFCA